MNTVQPTVFLSLAFGDCACQNTRMRLFSIVRRIVRPFGGPDAIIRIQPGAKVHQPAPSAAKGKIPGIHPFAAVRPGCGGRNRFPTYWTLKIHSNLKTSVRNLPVSNRKKIHKKIIRTPLLHPLLRHHIRKRKDPHPRHNRHRLRFLHQNPSRPLHPPPLHIQTSYLLR
jgi:hypothetical protein